MAQPVEDLSNGYERVADAYIAARGTPRAGVTAIGIPNVLAWAGTLPRGATILDVGCGPGIPVTQTLIEQGFTVYGVDASPRMVAAFQQRFPGVPCECRAIETSTFFDRRFDAAIAWGVIFLMPARVQPLAIARVAGALKPGGHFLFTAPREAGSWPDTMTGLMSHSLGDTAYRTAIEAAGLTLVGEDVDVGGNHYYLSATSSDG
jgi:SAM-dependent methyltransferase